MRVIATAGHVDHGKSTLVRALTGMEPDRWAEERQRGMTIDLGYAWTSLPSGEEVAFVDVPGHQRFIGNMLAGLGPAPAVLFVVAADEGWRRQSGEHLAAVDALGLRHAVLAVTRSDLADPGPATEQALERLAGSSLEATEAVAVSGATGAGLADLRAALDRMVARLPGPQADGRVRLWVDRAFTIKGSGTVVTGTLGAGTLRVGDELRLGDGTVSVRALQRLGASHDAVSAVARVAVNLRSVPLDQVARGDVLCTPQRWRDTALVDVRLGAPAAQLPAELVLHVGTAAVPVRVRGLGGRVARLTLSRPLPLQAGDRAILRDPGRASVAAGVLVLDADPPQLRRRGAAAARAAELASATGVPDLVTEVDRRGAARRADLAALGIPMPAESLPDEVPLVAAGDWLITAGTWQRWRDLVGQALERHRADDPLSPGLPLEAARRLAAIPDLGLCRQVAAAAGLELADGRLRRPGAGPTLGGAEAGVGAIEQRLTADPFAAPERDDLAGWGLGPRELAAAVTAGRLLRLRDDVVLLPSGPARAMRLLAALPQPFTASDARQALGTTRRVVIPLLEHLDDRGWTRRVDGSHREVRRS